MSWYKNHISPNSIFAWNYEDDFFAGYDHGKQAGLMSVADHHVVPGKKLWTWGNGPRGRMWDKILTDDDGPYIELMVGAYSDNQPDYSWLQPYEVKSFAMYWYPFRDIGGVKNANLDAAVNLEVNDGTAKVGFYTTVGASGGDRAAQGRRQGPAAGEGRDRPRQALREAVPVPAGDGRARPARLDLRRRQGTGRLFAHPAEARADAEAGHEPAARRRRSRPTRNST